MKKLLWTPKLSQLRKYILDRYIQKVMFTHRWPWFKELFLVASERAQLEEPMFEELLACIILLFCKLFFTEVQVLDIVVRSPEQLRGIFVVDLQFRLLWLVDEQSKIKTNSGG